MKFRVYAKNRSTGLCEYCNASNLREVSFDEVKLDGLGNVKDAPLIEFPNPKDFAILDAGFEGYEVVEVMYTIA